MPATRSFGVANSAIRPWSGFPWAESGAGRDVFTRRLRAAGLSGPSVFVMVRISKIEIAGRKRMKRKKRVRKSPSVPMKVIQSHFVPW